MDPRVPLSWQVHLQDAQHAPAPASNPSYSRPPPAPVHWRTVPLGGALVETVVENDANPSFAQEHRAIDRKYDFTVRATRTERLRIDIQHVLVSDRFQEYLTYTDPSTLKAVLERFQREAFAFANDQSDTLQSDIPYMAAYDDEVRIFELKLKAVEATATPTIRNLGNSVLLMMRSRYGSMRQDYSIRNTLLSVEGAIMRHSTIILQYQLRIKQYVMNSFHHDDIAKDDFWKIMNEMLPLHHMRQEKREELGRCRYLRALLEKKLRDARAHLEASEPEFGRIKMENVVKLEEEDVKKDAVKLEDV
jgi:hypothetical protein